jgi:type VI secretion system secreted protein VgrG
MPSAIPPKVDIDANIRLSRQRGTMNVRVGGRGPEWFRDQVKKTGPWDYKQLGSQYEDFGNFHYGATGAAYGFSEDFLLRMVGRGQIQDGTSDPSWGEAPSSDLTAYLGLGTAPFGDDPKDQFWIKQGILYYQQHYGRKP